VPTYILIVPPDKIDAVIRRLNHWFEDDVDVTIVAQGTTDKLANGVIILEFEPDGLPGPWFHERIEEDTDFLDYIIKASEEV
jgi:hypothetical protein